MKAELKAGHPVYDAMTDLFKFHREYGVPEHDDKYWAELTKKAGEIRAKYEHTEVADLVNRHLIETLVMLDGIAKGVGPYERR